MTQLLVSHGRSGQPLTVGHYRLTEARYAPDQQLPYHEHAFPSWTLLLAGSFEETFSRETLVCTTGSVLTKPSTADHSNRYGPVGAHCLLIEARSSVPEVADVFAAPRIVSAGVIPVVAQKIHRELRSQDLLSGIMLEALLVELTTATARVSNSAHPVSRKRWLNSVRDQLEENFRCPPSLSELAASHRVHPVYLCQEFRTAFGVNVGEFVRAVRFEWARAYLVSSGRSIADVALAAGFSDQAHFSRDFRRRTGMSPRRYRISSRDGVVTRTARSLR
ncbi:MAG: helix-turn-helix transcriptional regulator [Gemmatimonadaceae bacterium]